MADGRKRSVYGESVPAVMRIETGESIVGGWITPEIPGVGMYNLIAKKKTDGTCAWMHFIQRTNGKKEKFVGGTTLNEKEIMQVVAAINRSLERVYGPQHRLAVAGSTVCSLGSPGAGRNSVN